MLYLENACRMDVFDAKNNLKCDVNSLHNLGENKELRSRPCATMFVLIFVNFEACALCHEPPDDHVMPGMKCTLHGYQGGFPIHVHPTLKLR